HVLINGKRPLVWLAWAGTCFGLSLAARPNYLAATIALLFPVLFLLRARRDLSAVRIACTAFAPVASVGMLLLLYNWLRFGSITEFGMRYQLAGASFVDFTPLHVRHLVPHALEYLWAPARWSPYFPFLQARPDAPVGALRYLPLTWLAAFTPILATRRLTTPGGSSAAAFIRMLVTVAVANLVMLCLFFYAPMLRYTVDFVPVVLLLGGIGLMEVADRASSAAVRLGVLGVLTASAAPTLALFATRAAPSDSVAALERVLNRPVHWIQEMRGREHGPLAITVEAPEDTGTQSIPLLRTGLWEDRYDELRLRSRGGKVQLSLFHAGLGELRGKWLPLVPDRRLEMTLHSGALLPPSSHPVFRGWLPEEVSAAQQKLELRVNGEVVLAAALDSYPSRPSDWSQPTFENVVRMQQLPLQKEPSPSPYRRGIRQAQHLRLQLPAVPGSQEPLISTGAANQSDLLYVIYGPGHVVRFGLDHFGERGRISEPHPYDPLATHDLYVWMGAWAGAHESAEHGQIKVVFNGHVVLNGPQNFYPGEDYPTIFGLNANGAGSAGPEFRGRILSIEDATPAAVFLNDESPSE
ncbi:MAG TPA: hypothetical protein VHF69_12940, partial [Candidatus Synoicihabitans sp.]|nr:hypothetical protein [Candidatus Synoicihabitans sp.]